ncbi:MAG: SseB family protein [Clostridia bacterium]|nr:SseB family protein [Clostridia bacterium]
MKIGFKTTYVNDELKYSVGLAGPVGMEDYAMRVVDPTHIIMTDPETWTPGTDPSALFGLTEEEYNWKDTDLEKLDELAQRLRTDIPKDRLLGESEGVRKKDRVESIDYGKYVRNRKERMERRTDEMIGRMLAAEELYVMYCGETNKPYVFQYSHMQVFEDKALAMELANEYRKYNIPLLVATLNRSQLNAENAKSFYQELMVLGYPLIMFFDAEKRQAMIQIKDIIKHKAYIGQKNNLVYGNPKLDFAMTNLFQFMRTPNNIDRSDPEKFKEIVTKTLGFMEGRFIEALSDARFLIPTKAMPDGKVLPAIIKMAQKKPAAAPAEGAEEAAKTEAAEGEVIEKNFLPVFSNGMEFNSDNDQYKAAVLPLDEIIKMVKGLNLDGLLINMKSKCAMPCGPERFEQVEKYREWKAEHQAEAGQNEEIPESLEAPVAANDETAEDTPFVPIVNKNNE